ncbi:MAG: hypothetical protein ACREIW_08265 [Chthoniobacterales bacterium]
MTERFLFVALLMFATVALADGAYQRTRNGKALVWNDDPKSGDEATWSGARDREGYARGFGTLVWYTKGNGTGSAKPELYARYWGNMARGKLDGPVNGHSKGKTRHAFFADGVRVTRWEPGSASSLEAARWRAVIATRSTVREPETPAEGPVSVEISRTQNSGSESPTTETSSDLAFNSQRPQPVTNVSPPESPPETEIDIGETVRLLVWPPPTLGMRYISKGPRGDIKARLTRGEVIDLADTAARSRGYNPIECQLPEPHYDPSDQAWSLLYEEKPADGTGEIRKHFSIAVGDKTKQTALVPGK